MVTPNPAIKINGNVVPDDDNPAYQQVTEGATVTLTLVDITGIKSVSYGVHGVYNCLAPTFNLSGSPLGSTATFTAPTEIDDGYGYAVGITVTVNGGVNSAGELDNNLTFKTKVYLPDTSGSRRFFLGETTESGSSGWASIQRDITLAKSGATGTVLAGDVTGGANSNTVESITGDGGGSVSVNDNLLTDVGGIELSDLGSVTTPTGDSYTLWVDSGDGYLTMTDASAVETKFGRTIGVRNGVSHAIVSNSHVIGISEIESALTAETDTALALTPDGAGGVQWASVGGSQDLSEVLTEGNITDGTDIDISSGDAVNFLNDIDIQEAGTTRIATSGTTLNVNGNVLVAIQTAGTNRLTVGQFGTTLTPPILAFANTVAAPQFGQIANTTADATAENLSIRAQAATGSGSAITAGNLILNGGDASAGTATQRNGGDVTIQSGAGDAMGRHGEISISRGGATDILTTSAGGTVVNNFGTVALAISDTSKFSVSSTAATLTVSELNFNFDVENPTIQQGANSNTDAVGEILTMQAQNVTGSGDLIAGGDISIRGGDTGDGSATVGWGGDIYLTTGSGLGEDGYAGNFHLAKGDGSSVLTTDENDNIDLGDIEATTAIVLNEGYVFIPDGTSIPTDPSGGGYLFSEGGALKWRGSSGSITTLGAS